MGRDGIGGKGEGIESGPHEACPECWDWADLLGCLRQTMWWVRGVSVWAGLHEAGPDDCIC